MENPYHEIPDMDEMEYFVLNHFIQSESVHQAVWEGILHGLRMSGMGYIASDKMAKPVPMMVTGEHGPITRIFYVPTELAHATLKKYLVKTGVQDE